MSRVDNFSKRTRVIWVCRFTRKPPHPDIYFCIEKLLWMNTIELVWKCSFIWEFLSHFPTRIGRARKHLSGNSRSKTAENCWAALREKGLLSTLTLAKTKRLCRYFLHFFDFDVIQQQRAWIPFARRSDTEGESFAKAIQHRGGTCFTTARSNVHMG